jgi:uncharacterized membrane protein YbhN (UPF0104 family)
VNLRKTSIIAFALAAVLLFYALRGIDWREVGRILAVASLPLLAISCVVTSVTLLLRACRWRVLLNAEGSVSVPAAFWATAAGTFGNNFLPARAGELVRTFMISSRTALGSPYVLATALAERVADAVVLVCISAVVLLILPAQPGWLAGAAKPFGLLGLVGALAIAVLPFMGAVGHKVIARLPLPAAMRPRIIAWQDHGLRGLRAFHDVGRLCVFLGLTVVIWSLDAFGVIAAAAALELQMPIVVSFLLMTGLGLAGALPSTPGYVGIYQFVAVTVLTPFGFSRTEAIAYILVGQALNVSVIGLWGSVGLWRHRRTPPS